MDDDDFGIAAFEDPAPSKDNASYLDIAGSNKPSKTTKKRLRYRPDIQIAGSRYKGQRTTREELQLDKDTLGLFSDDDKSVGGLQGIDAKAGVDTQQGGENDNDDDSDTDLVDSDAAQRSPELRKNQPGEDEEERAIAKRLAESKAKDQQRAVAVRKQKAVYDAMVSMRIRLETLMNLARSFPSKDQRKQIDDWQSTDELTSALQSSHSALQSLVTHSESAWETSWPMPVMDDSEEDDIIDSEEDVDSGEVKKPTESKSLDKHKTFEQWRDALLNQWGKKVNDATGVIPKGGFKSFDTSVSSQVQAALSTGKQLERTKKVKDPLPMLGGNLELEEGIHEMHFDDGEFYRTLLREIIESGDAPGGGLRYAQLSKQGRIKKKRSVASKGKRIKYEVHDKMIGFLPALKMRDLGPIDEIIANLFGERRKVKN